MDEVMWLSVVGYEHLYEVSNTGSVRSLNRIDTKGRLRKGRVMTCGKDSKGYPRVSLSDSEGVRTIKHVHVVMLEAFKGERPAGMHGCHEDGNPANCVLSNLRWGTPRSNYDDRVAHGKNRGEKHHLNVITEKVAREIKTMAADRTISARRIAEKFGVKPNIVESIRYGKSWGWL